MITRHPLPSWQGLRVAQFLAVSATLAVVASDTAVGQLWVGQGSNNNWSSSANWNGGSTPSMTNATVLLFSGGSQTTANNDMGNWRDIARIEFGSNASSFTLTGDAVGFQPYQGLTTNDQRITQNSPFTQTINLAGMSFRPAVDSKVFLNDGDLVINSPNVYIDMSNDAWRSLTLSSYDASGSMDVYARRTLTISGNLNRGGSGRDPDIYITNNKRLLVTGGLNTGQGDDTSVFIDYGVLEFGGSGGMSGGKPKVGASSGSASAALLMNTAGATFSRQVSIGGGSSGRRIVGGVNTAGTVTYAGDFVSENSPGDFDLRAAGGGTVAISGQRNLDAGLYVNRPDGGSTFGGTVVLSANTTSSSWTALEAGTLQFGDFAQLGSSHLEFNASSGDSGTLRYTGGSTTTTKTLWIDNPGITRAAIDVSQAGTTLTWNPADGGINRNLTKLGAGTLAFGGGRITGGAVVSVEAGTLLITGTNTYSGATTVSGGRLAVNGVLGNTPVSVQSGGEVGGAGAIGGSIAVLAGGTLSPGNSIQSLAGGATSFAAAAVYEYEYDSADPLNLGSAADLLVVNGNFSIDSGALITFADLAASPQAFINTTTEFALVNYTGAWNGGLFTYAGTPLADGATFSVGSQQWMIDYNRGTSAGLDNFTGDYAGGSFVAITAVPEPASLALAATGGLAALGLTILRRRPRIRCGSVVRAEPRPCIVRRASPF